MARVSHPEIDPIRKRRFFHNSSLRSKFNPRNIAYMPAVKFIERLDLRKNPTFQDGNNSSSGYIHVNLLKGTAAIVMMIPKIL